MRFDPSGCQDAFDSLVHWGENISKILISEKSLAPFNSDCDTIFLAKLQFSSLTSSGFFPAPL